MDTFPKHPLPGTQGQPSTATWHSIRSALGWGEARVGGKRAETWRSQENVQH